MYGACTIDQGMVELPCIEIVCYHELVWLVQYNQQPEEGLY